jgi:hypothetical protein
MACPDCRAVNSEIKDQFAACLPLGRHSLMNGGAVDLSEPRKWIRDRQQAHLAEVVDGMRSLADWKRQQADRIHATLMPSRFRAAGRIPTDEWVAHAEPSWDASCRAWLDYCDLSDFEELHDRMLRLYSAGRIPWPPFIPIRGWRPQRPEAQPI